MPQVDISFSYQQTEFICLSTRDWTYHPTMVQFYYCCVVNFFPANHFINLSSSNWHDLQIATENKKKWRRRAYITTNFFSTRARILCKTWLYSYLYYWHVIYFIYQLLVQFLPCRSFPQRFLLYVWYLKRAFYARQLISRLHFRFLCSVDVVKLEKLSRSFVFHS